ncbi:MAG: RNA polymerase sigma factor [Bacteroidia bacterium]|nr:RNA polymerase sigma factor [Bacteroidia bacterium]
MAQTTEKELIQQAIEGNSSAFRRIVESYQDQVARTVVSMLGRTQSAEDVGQEVFIRLYKSLEKFRGEAGLGTYITRIAINLSLNEIKRRDRKRLFSFSSQEDQDRLLNVPNEDLSEEEWARREWVQAGLQVLEPKFRSVVVLRMIQGYSTKETAKILNLPQGTILSRLARGQDKLKVILENLQSVNTPKEV